MHTDTDQIVSVIVRRRVPILVSVALVTAVMGWLLTRIEVNNDPRSTVPPGLPELQEYNRLQETFHTPRVILLVAEFGPCSLREKLDSMASWGAQFRDAEGVAEVMHLGTIKAPVAGGLLGMTADFVVRPGASMTDEQLRERVRSYREFTSAFISGDETALGMVISVDESVNQQTTARSVSAVRTRIAASTSAQIFMTGPPLYADEIDRAMRRDFRLLLPLSLAIVFALLLWVFGRMYHVLVSLAIIAIALVWTFGLMAATGVQFSVVTAMIPVILFPIGVASAIHVFKTYARRRAERPQAARLELIQATFHELLNPVFLSAITTVFGFISFAFSRTIWTRNFGIFTSAGVAFAFVLSVLLLPVFLSYDRRETPAGWTLPGTLGGPPGLWRWYERWAVSSYRWLWLVALLLAVSVVGYLRVRVEGNPLGMFAKGSELRRTDERIARHLGGTLFMSVVLTRDDGPIATVDDWRDVQRMVDYLGGREVVSASTSLLLLINRVSRVLSDTSISQPALTMLLGGKGLLGKNLASYINAWLTPDRRQTKVTLLCRSVSGTRYIQLAREISSTIPKRFPGWHALATGTPVLNDAMTFVLVETQVSSVLSTFLLVFAILCLLFRSWRIGAVAVTPIVLSTAFVYGLMGFFNVAMNSVTIITVNTCIGIGIDYAIHFTAGYRYARAGYPSRAAALIDTVRTKGAVIVFNTLVVGIGFLALAFSSFPPIRHFGLFVFVSMITSCAFALVFLPALYARFEAAPARPRKPAPHQGATS